MLKSFFERLRKFSQIWTSCPTGSQMWSQKLTLSPAGLHEPVWKARLFHLSLQAGWERAMAAIWWHSCPLLLQTLSICGWFIWKLSISLGVFEPKGTVFNCGRVLVTFDRMCTYRGGTLGPSSHFQSVWNMVGSFCESVEPVGPFWKKTAGITTPT